MYCRQRSGIVNRSALEVVRHDSTAPNLRPGDNREDEFGFARSPRRQTATTQGKDYSSKRRSLVGRVLASGKHHGSDPNLTRARRARLGLFRYRYLPHAPSPGAEVPNFHRSMHQCLRRRPGGRTDVRTRPARGLDRLRRKQRRGTGRRRDLRNLGCRLLANNSRTSFASTIREIA
jgi:hypothetical protein